MSIVGAALGAFVGVLRPLIDHQWAHVRISLARRRDRATWTSLCGLCSKEWK